MSGYLRSQPFKSEFDGDTVTAQLKPLQFEDLLKVNSAGGEMETLKVFQEILPKYVDNLAGPLDAAGSQVSIQEICGAVYFLSLVGDLGQCLVGGATLKNPQKPAELSAS